MSGFVGTVTTEAQLNTDIQLIDGTTAAGNYTITFGANITEGNISITQNGATVLPDLSAIDLHSGVTLTINGAGDSLIGTNGSNTFRGLFVYSGNVSVNNLTISKTVATGGAGGSSGNFTGGGGAGLGGGLFIGKSGTVTLNQVYFSGDKAAGGAGGIGNTATLGNNPFEFYAGGGGLGGAGASLYSGGGTNYNSGGGGGIGRTAVGATTNLTKLSSAFNQAGIGIVTGAASGGAGGSQSKSGAGGKYGGGGGYGYLVYNGSPATDVGAGGGGGGVGGHAGIAATGGGTGGAGGFGGGGGGGFITGGAGGFGGGGGGGYNNGGAGGWGGGGGASGDAAGGVGGFGGGTGASAQAASPAAFRYRGGGGGGGLGAGGDVFVYQGGSLIIQSGSLSGGSVTGGAAGTGYKSGTAGSAIGSGVFLYGSQTANFSPALGKTLSISDQIIDQKGAGNGSNTGAVLVNGAGEVILSATNSFWGGTTIQAGGTLDLAASGAGGNGAIRFGAGDAAGFGRLDIQSAAFANGGTFVNTLSNFIAGNVLDLAGLTFHSGASATVSGSTIKVVSNGVTDTVNYTGATTGFTVIADGGTGSAVITTAFTVTSAADLSADLLAINTGGVDAASGVAYSFDFTSSFAIAATQTINLGSGSSVNFNGGNAATGGGFEIAAGSLVAGATGAIGNGAITVDAGGSLSLGTFNQTISALSGSGSVNLGSAVMTDTGATSTSFAGSISGSGGLVKQGSGTLTLTGSNSFSAATTISAGAVQLGSGGATGSLSGNIVDNSALLIDQTGTVTIAGTISGTGTLTQDGSGVTVLSGPNSFSGGDTVTSGILRLGATNAAGSGPLAVASGATFDLAGFAQTTGDLSGAGSITLGAGTLTAGTANSTLFSGAISGTGGLLKQGTGTLSLTGADGATGLTTINAGVLQLGNGGSTGSLSGNVTDNATLAINETGTVTLGGTISGIGALLQSGSGTTALTAADSYSGGTTIQAGTLQVGNGGGIAGAVTDNAVLAINDTATVTLGGTISGTGMLLQAGSGTTKLTAADSYGGGTTIQAGTLQLGNGGATGSIAGAVTDNATLAINETGTLTLSGTISGTGGLLQSGSGTTALTAADSYSGGTTIQAGTLQVGNGGAIAGNVTDNAVLAINSTATVILSGTISGTGALLQSGSGTTELTAADSYSGGTTIQAGTLQLGNGGATGGITGNVTDNATLAVNETGNLTLSGTISGSGTLIKAGSGTVTLSGPNTFTGGVTLSAGTLLLNATGAAGTGAVSIASGSTLSLGTINQTISVLSGAGSVNLGTATLTEGSSAATTLSGAITGAGTLVKQGSGTLTLSGSSNFSGGTTLESGGTLNLAASSAAGSGAISFGTGFGTLAIQSAAFTNGSTFGNTIGNFTAGNLIDLTGLAYASGASASVSGSTLKVISNGVTDALTLSSPSLAYAVIRDTGTGSDVIESGFTIASAANLAADLLAINVGGTDSFAGAAYTFDFTSSFAIGSVQTIDLASGASVGFTGGNATTGGGYDIIAGTLTANAAGAIGSGAITVGASGALSLGSFNQTIGDLSGAGAINLGSATLTEGTTDTTTFSGTISGAGILAERGGGKLTLSGANNFSGGVTINTGTLALGVAGAAGSGPIIFAGGSGTLTGVVQNNSTIIAQGGTYTINSPVTTGISANGTLEVGASADLVLPDSVDAGQQVVFAGDTALLTIGSVAGFAATLSGFVTTDSIDLSNLSGVTSVDIVGGNTLAVSTAGPTYDLVFGAGQTFAAGKYFHHASDGGSGTLLTESDVPCFCTGTRIRTTRGDVPVEHLAVGDRVITAAGSERPVCWIGRRQLDIVRHPAPRRVQPVCIRADAFADGVPARDLFVSPDHAVLRDGVLVPARLLINGASIRRDTARRSVCYYHVELDRHDILLADGLAAESYLDTGNRGMFARAGSPLVLHPDVCNDQARREAESCAPFADLPDQIEPIWQSLAARAVRRGLALPPVPQTTNDPALCLLVDGNRRGPVSVVQGRYVFVLPRTDRLVRLVSRATVRPDTAPWVTDDRRLGVQLRGLLIRTSDGVWPIPLDHPDFGDGWWLPEWHGATMLRRWTNGDAAIPVSRAASSGPCLLEVDVAATVPYPVPEAATDLARAAA